MEGGGRREKERERLGVVLDGMQIVLKGEVIVTYFYEQIIKLTLIRLSEIIGVDFKILSSPIL